MASAFGSNILGVEEQFEETKGRHLHVSSGRNKKNNRCNISKRKRQRPRRLPTVEHVGSKSKIRVAKERYL